MEATQKARESYIQAESNKRIRRALRHNVRTYADERYCNSDKVYYRRKNFKGWKGPDVVLGQDGVSMFLSIMEVHIIVFTLPAYENS